MLRRVRGILGSMLAWAAPWALAGAGLAVWLHARGGYQWQRLMAHLDLIGWPAWAGGGVGYLAARGALVGAVNGALFAAVVLLAHRRGTPLDRLSRWGFAGIGAFASGAVAVAALSMPAALAAVVAAVGALSGASYLTAAQRGQRLSRPVDDHTAGRIGGGAGRTPRPLPSE
jgi:hypothetical protein